MNRKPIKNAVRLVAAIVLSSFLMPSNVYGDGGGPGICVRNYPEWIYEYPNNVCSPVCLQTKHSTGSSCQPDLLNYCYNSLAYVPYYYRTGNCMQDDTGADYCDFSSGAWSTSLSNDLVPTCASTVGGGGGINN